MLVRKDEQTYKIGRCRDRRSRASQRGVGVGGQVDLCEGLAKAFCMPALPSGRIGRVRSRRCPSPSPHRTTLALVEMNDDAFKVVYVSIIERS